MYIEKSVRGYKYFELFFIMTIVKLGFFGFANDGKEHEGFKQFLGNMNEIKYTHKTPP